MDIRTVAIFKNRNNQAVRLPKEFEFTDAVAVEMTKVGEEIILRPVKNKKPSWDTLYDEIQAHPKFEADKTSISDSTQFMKLMGHD